MFFSIVIPTYNPRSFLPTLLSSICNNECINDIEVIVSDDCSTEQFDDVLTEYKQLNIVKISNKKHSGFPRNGRQHGLEQASGEWVCFADQDDCFVDGIFDRTKQLIEEQGLQNTIAYNVILKDEELSIEEERHGNMRATHGKFFEKSFLTKYNISYDRVQKCEDLNFCTKILCTLYENDLEPYIIEEPAYIWQIRSTSLCNDEYRLDMSYDFAKAVIGVSYRYLSKYRHDEKLFPQYCYIFFEDFLSLFFYIQCAEMHGKTKTIEKAIEYVKPLFSEFKIILQYTNSDIIKLVNTIYLERYNEIRNNIFYQIFFIEQMTFNDYLNVYFN